MNNIRLLNQNDLDSYIELMKFGHHNYEWDRYYLENVGIDRLKTILSNHTDYWNIFGAFEDDEIVNRELINHIIQYAKEHNIETLMIAIASNNISAKVFFSSIGFENLAFEKNASKIGNEYFDENWLIYSTTESSE